MYLNYMFLTKVCIFMDLIHIENGTLIEHKKTE